MAWEDDVEAAKDAIATACAAYNTAEDDYQTAFNNLETARADRVAAAVAVDTARATYNSRYTEYKFFVQDSYDIIKHDGPNYFMDQLAIKLGLMETAFDDWRDAGIAKEAAEEAEDDAATALSDAADARDVAVSDLKGALLDLDDLLRDPPVDD